MNKPASRFRRFVPLVAIILVVGLFGHSIGVVGELEPMPLTVGAMVIAGIACAVTLAFRPMAHYAEKKESPLAGRGLRVAMSGFLTAAAGWLVAVYLSPFAGIALIGIGIVLSIAGIALGQFSIVTKR